MKSFSGIKNLLVFLSAAIFLIGCSDVAFEGGDIVGKASNEEIVSDPDNPPNEEQPDPDPDLPPNPEPETVTQKFLQKAGGDKLDILVIIDNSDSMMVDHSKHKIQKMFSGFLGTLDGLDYQVGFTTTDMKTVTWLNKEAGWSGRLDTLDGTNGEKILTPQTPNKSAVFLDTIDREETLPCRRGEWDGLCGTNYEEPLRAIMAFVDKKDDENLGFFRDGANFISIIVTDENELSDGREGATQPSEVVNHISKSFNGTKVYRNYGVIIEPGDKACKKEQACSEFLCLGGGNYGTFIAELAQQTSGRTTSICSSDITPDLKVIGENARGGGLLTSVTLQHEPIEGSVQVIMNPASDIEFLVVGRTVEFSRAPAGGTEITVRYQHN